MSSLRKCGAVLPLSPYAFMTCTQTTLRRVHCRIECSLWRRLLRIRVLTLHEQTSELHFCRSTLMWWRSIVFFNWYCTYIQLVLYLHSTGTVPTFNWYCTYIQLVLYLHSTGTVPTFFGFEKQNSRYVTFADPCIIIQFK